MKHHLIFVLAIFVFILGTVSPQVQPSISFTPAQPRPGETVTFTLHPSTSKIIGSAIVWDFGDSTATLPTSTGQRVVSHVFARVGTFVVGARYYLASERIENPKVTVTVGEAEGPRAAFAISGLLLRWNDGRTAIQVGKDFSPLIAYADLKFQGTGILYYQWLVDGNAFKTGQAGLTFAGQATIDSGATPGLPTQTPGIHQVSLRFVRPAASFALPVITYEVAAASRRLPAPRIEQAVPSQLEPGKDYELSLVGSGLTPDTDISLGPSIAILEKAKILSGIQATLKVFVPLTAKKGEYPVSASNANGTSSGPAAVTIGLATKPIVTAKPLPAKAFCPDFSAVKHGLTMMVHGYSRMKEMVSGKVFVLDDYPTFSWTPANLGQTEFWDFIILDKSRKNVLFRRRLDAFVLQTKLTSAEVVKLVADAKGSRWAPQTEALAAQSSSEAGIPVETEVPDWTIDGLAWKIADKGDVYIGVAGYRRYACLGGSLTGAKPTSSGPQTKTGDEFAFRTYEIVTEHSTLFPYKLPGLPAGIVCPEGGQTRPGNSVQCTPVKETIKMPGGKLGPDPNNYVDTPFFVKGDFSVDDSPYNVEGGDFSYPAKTPPTGESPYSSIQPANAPPIIDFNAPKAEAGPPKTANFSNIFIDWGDGTVERLSAEPSDPDMHYWQYRDLGVLGVLGSNNRAVRWHIIPPKDHCYKKTGIYTFRIYQLGEDDIQQPAQNFTGALGEATSGGAGDADFDYLSSIIGKSGPKAEKTETDPSAALGGALSRAYLIFCTNITITNRIDLCADGPLNLVSLQITGFPLHDVKKALAIAAVAGPDAVATTCDSGLHAVANLIYFGRGSVEVSWRVGDVIIGKSRIDGLSSPPRTGLSKGEQGDCDNAIKAVLEIKSPPLPVQELGKYSVKAEARVVFNFDDPGLATTSFSALQSLQAKSGNLSSQAWLNALKGAQSPQVGLINSGSGPGAFAYLNDILPTALASLSAAAFDQPPLAVSSGPKIYEVKAADPKQLCRVWIPTPPEGRFEVSDLQNNVQKDATGFKGQGMLHLPLSRSSDANETYLVPIQFSGWQVDEASGDLKNGALDFSPGLSVLPPGTKGTVDRVAVKVTNGTGTPLTAIMSLGFRDQALRLPGEVETPPQFPKLSATLTAEGDWLKENVVLPEILIGWSAFHIKSPAIAFDFHKKKGALPAGECSNGEVSWVGVNLGQATILPYTFDMVGNTPYVLQVNNWGIVDKGMCGKLQGGPFHADYQEGWLEFGGLTFSAANASYVVQYKNLVVHVPWVGTDLKGDATLKKFEGGYGIDLGAVTGQAPPLDYGQFVLRPQDLSFLSEKNLGWVVGSVTACEFNADGKPFAKLTLAHLFFGFDGRAYFEEGATSKMFSLGGQSTLGSTPLDLINVDIAAPSKGTGRLDFAFHTKVHLSENPIIPAADAQINYNVFRSGAAYQGTGPTNNPFTCEVVFPVGNPVMTAQIRPVYYPAGSSPGGGAEPVPAALGGAGPSEFETGVSAGASQDTHWYGDLDMALFGGPSVKAQLLIGYRSGKSYFLMRADYPLGPTGIPFAPLPFSLFRLSGALGYNFPVDAFKNVSTTSIADAEPDMGGDTLFMSGMRIGSSDKFSFTLDGTFTVSTAGAARMDFGAWILQAPSGTANFQGCFTYGGGNFDGRLWGRLSFFGDLILFDLGTSESNAAVDLHFGSGTWHIYAGQKDGARIRAKVLFGESDAYLMLGTDVGLALGGAFDMYFGIGDSSIASAYVKAFMDIGLQVTPQPKVVGDFAAGVSAGVCALGICVDGSVDAQVHVEAFPVDASASVSLDLPWPLPSISFTVHL